MTLVVSSTSPARRRLIRDVHPTTTRIIMGDSIVGIEIGIGLDAVAEHVLQKRGDANPLIVRVGSHFTPYPRLTVTITNVSRDLTCHVHAVSLVCGVDSQHNWSFPCEPQEKVSITPKDSATYFIPFPPTLVSQTVLASRPPLPSEAQPPPFRSPFGLWRLFALCRPDQSWVAIDFNEFRHREYCRGDVRGIFEGTLSLLPDEPPDSLAPSPL